MVAVLAVTPDTCVLAPMTPDVIDAAVQRLRAARNGLLATYGAEGLQAKAVTALAAVARSWLDLSDPHRRAIIKTPQSFSYEETWPSLKALCESMTEVDLWQLIDAEGVRGKLGPEVVGHVIAGNTPLLAWTSAARALLVGSASLLKLPSGDLQVWSRALFASLEDASPDLARLVMPISWSSADFDCTRTFCTVADKVVAYGSDQTMAALRSLLPPDRKLLEYGHRVSCAIVAQGADEVRAANGIAWDTWVYDQGGCLSPQCVFVGGSPNNAVRFGGLLASALSLLPSKTRSLDDAAKVIEQRSLARMHEGTRLYEDPALTWTVCVSPTPRFQVNDAPIFIYVVSSQELGMIATLRLLANHLQGICLGTSAVAQREQWLHALESLGVSLVVEPGGLQCPPFSWRENGRDVLRSLLQDV